MTQHHPGDFVLQKSEGESVLKHPLENPPQNKITKHPFEVVQKKGGPERGIVAVLSGGEVLMLIA